MGLFASLLALFGCDQQQIDKVRQQARDAVNAVKPDNLMLKDLKPGESTEADIRGQMGKPEIVWENEDGSRRLEYPRSPGGLRTYMVDIGPDGKLRAVSQALTDQNFQQVRPGMTKDDVRRLLGKPTSVAEYRLKREEVWSWRWLEDGVNTSALFNAHFGPDGRIVTTSRAPDPAGERP
ncbi:lipoprotein [Pandoraea terrae]|uniref:Lipoprotein n=1 Tax=Pandoraea terrae TaxID=1537710 RepID=A0A5E4RKP8_9BURK|nr:outer membrane protein assembly factor BamE [Pandoraea terrae]VVD63503.1 lipoprotein [Pandoraea terrae]